MTDEFQDAEVVDGLPVLAEPATDEQVVARPPGWRGVLAAVPKREAAVVAASFAAGAAALAVASARRGPKPRKLTRSSLGDIVGTDHYLIDVHRIRPRS